MKSIRMRTVQLSRYAYNNTLVIVNLLTLPTPHELRLSARVVDITPELAHTRLRRCLGLLNGGVDFCLGGLVVALDEHLLAFTQVVKK